MNGRSHTAPGSSGRKWSRQPEGLEHDDEQLRAVSAQTLLLIGDQERTYAPRKALHRASRLMPAIDARLIADAGHILAMQKPDTVDAEVVSFLSRSAVPE
jgi:pimeloyl-ACP methyl ester carboxylesterase